MKKRIYKQMPKKTERVAASPHEPVLTSKSAVSGRPAVPASISPTFWSPTFWSPTFRSPTFRSSKGYYKNFGTSWGRGEWEFFGKVEISWSYLSENIQHPMVYQRSVTLQMSRIMAHRRLYCGSWQLYADHNGYMGQGRFWRCLCI